VSYTDDGFHLKSGFTKKCLTQTIPLQLFPTIAKITRDNYIFLIVFCEYQCKCKECGKGFTVSTSLKKHVLTHIRRSLLIVKRVEQVFHSMVSWRITCAVSVKLKKHILTHTREKPCIQEECGVGYSKSSNLMKHISTHGENFVVWEECGSWFLQTGYLQNFMNLTM